MGAFELLSQNLMELYLNDNDVMSDDIFKSLRM